MEKKSLSSNYRVVSLKTPPRETLSRMTLQGQIRCSSIVLLNAILRYTDTIRSHDKVSITTITNPHRPLSKFTLGLFITAEDQPAIRPFMITETVGRKPTPQKIVPWDIYALDYATYDAVMSMIEDYLMATTDFKAINAEIDQIIR